MSYTLPFLLETNLLCRGLFFARTPHNRLSETELVQLDMPYEASVLKIRSHGLLRRYVNLRNENQRGKGEKANIDFHLLVKFIR